MGKRRKKAGGRFGLQVVTLCISTMMVLVVLGLLVFFVLTTRNLSVYVKENLTVTVMLEDSVNDAQARQMCREVGRRVYARQAQYISKEDAQREQSAAMGADPSEFLGFNPFSATIEVRLKSDYANGDSLKWISAALKKDGRVADVAYQEDLMDSVNDNMRKLSVILLGLSVLLMCVSFSLITWGFIRRPFLRRAAVIGIVASALACALLGAGAYAVYYYEPGIVAVVTWRELAATAAAVFAFGLVISLLCTYFSVNRFLRMSAGEIYEI